MASKNNKIDLEIEEIVTGSEETPAAPAEAPAEPAPKRRRPAAKAQPQAEVYRQFVANDYLTALNPSDELYHEAMEEAGEDADPWDVNVSIKMGRKPTGENETFMIRVNGRKYDLAYRQTHSVPLPIAIAWLDHETSNDIAEDMADTMTENYQKLANDKIL